MALNMLNKYYHFSLMNLALGLGDYFISWLISLSLTLQCG